MKRFTVDSMVYALFSRGHSVLFIELSKEAHIQCTVLHILQNTSCNFHFKNNSADQSSRQNVLQLMT